MAADASSIRAVEAEGAGMSLLLMDTQSDLLIEIKVTQPVLDTLSLQWVRLTEDRGRTTFSARFGAQLAIALCESLDWDLKPPTPAQVAYATGIAKGLGIALPGEVLRYRGQMNEFLDLHNHAFKYRS